MWGRAFMALTFSAFPMSMRWNLLSDRLPGNDNDEKKRDESRSGGASSYVKGTQERHFC